jgi:hypothetical protein
MAKNPKKMVQDPQAHADVKTARNMADAANADQSIQGYASINGLNEDDEIARIAYKLYQERNESGREGSADDDWFRAEQEVRRNRPAVNA